MSFLRLQSSAPETRRVFVASFVDAHDLLNAVRALRGAGHVLHDVYTPYPVHGLPEAMGLRPSRLGWVTFTFGAAAGTAGMLLQYYLSAYEWPLNIGGRPWHSWPAFVPVGFELTVLVGALATVGAFLLTFGLLPGRRPVGLQAGATDDRFVLVVPERDATFDARELEELCRQFNAVHCDEQIETARGEVLS